MRGGERGGEGRRREGGERGKGEGEGGKREREGEKRREGMSDSDGEVRVQSHLLYRAISRPVFP